VLDKDVLTIEPAVVRLTRHVLAATIRVGGQIAPPALMGPLRQSAPAAFAPAARCAWVSWPGQAVLVLTGVWRLAGAGTASEAFRATLMVLVFVLASGVGTALHAVIKSRFFQPVRRCRSGQRAVRRAARRLDRRAD
jgi:hypothetical protein